MKSVLYSNRNFGGAEIYVRCLAARFGIPYYALQGATLFEKVSLIFSAERLILHDLRAGSLALLRLWSNDVIIIHGPGTSKVKMTSFLTVAYLLRRQVLFVSQSLHASCYPKLKSWHVVENISSFDVSLKTQNKDFIYFGRLTKEKGVHTLAAYWESHHSQRTLHVIGDGPLRGSLEQINCPYIKIYGARTQQYIQQVIHNNVAFYISLSPREGLSLSLLEAMSCGLVPIVVNMPSQQFLSDEIGIPLVKSDMSNLDSVLQACEDNISLYSAKAKNWFSTFQSASAFDQFWTTTINAK